jgi:hypothetical protein
MISICLYKKNFYNLISVNLYFLLFIIWIFLQAAYYWIRNKQKIIKLFIEFFLRDSFIFEACNKTYNYGKTLFIQSKQFIIIVHWNLS